MAKTRGTGLLMVWVDVDPEYEAELHTWYDEEHIPRLLAVPGFRSGGRYVALKGSLKNLVLYELESTEVLHTAAFLDEVRFRPSARRARVSGATVGRNYLHNALPADIPDAYQPHRNDQRAGAIPADGAHRYPVDRRRRVLTTGTTPPTSRPISPYRAALAQDVMWQLIHSRSI
jgi:hypothetical protein